MPEGNPHGSDVGPRRVARLGKKRKSYFEEVEPQAESRVTLPNVVRICSGPTCNSSTLLFFGGAGEKLRTSVGWILAVMGNWTKTHKWQQQPAGLANNNTWLNVAWAQCRATLSV